MFKKIEEFSKLENASRIKFLAIILVVVNMSLVFTYMADRTLTLEKLHHVYVKELDDIRIEIKELKRDSENLENLLHESGKKRQITFNNGEIDRIVAGIGEALRYELGLKNLDVNISDIRKKLMSEDEIRAKMEKLEKQYTMDDIYDYIDMFEQEIKHFLNSEKTLQNIQ